MGDPCGDRTILYLDFISDCTVVLQYYCSTIKVLLLYYCINTIALQDVTTGGNWVKDIRDNYSFLQLHANIQQSQNKGLI